MTRFSRASSSFIGALAFSLPAVALGDTFVPFDRSEPFVELTAIPGIRDVTELSFSSMDEGQVSVRFPFEFDFLGEKFRAGSLSTNGVLTFGADVASAFTNVLPGSGTGPSAFIAPFWDDLVHPSLQGARSGLLGSGRSRVFILEGGPASAYGQSGGTVRYQIWLYEGDTGRFEYRVTGTSLGDFTGTIGFEGAVAADPLACSPLCSAADLASSDGLVFGAQRAVEPELTGTLTGFPRGALPGEVVSGEVTLRNLGRQNASGVLATVYLSRDEVLDPTDIVVGTTRRVRVPGNERATTVTATLSVPLGTPALDGRLLLEVDTPNAFAELDETDNVVVSEAFATAHDLAARAVAQAGASPGANPGEPIEFEVTVDNQGAPLRGPLTVELFASLDGAFDPNDTRLGQAELRLRGLPSETVAATVTLPALPPGRYTPIASVAGGPALVELGTANNVTIGATPFPIGPDFTAPEIRLPVRPGPGGTVSVTTALGSEGVRFRGRVPYRLLASRDALVDAGDHRLGDFEVTFAGQERVEDTRTVTLPASITAGLYTVLAVLDPDGFVPEIREDNNVGASASALAAGTDLALEGPVTVTPAAGEAGDAIAVSATLVSAGTPYSGPVAYRIFLSPDATLDDADDAVAEGLIDLTGEASRPLALGFTLPNDVIVRGYRVLVALDPDGVLEEASEDNNVAASASPFNVRGADLRVARIEGEALGFSGLPYRVQLTLANEGAASARAFRYAYYLSDNELIRFTDTQVFISETTTIAAGATASFTDLIDIPTLTSTRAVYLGVIVDVHSRVPETSEGNNIARMPEPVPLVFPIPNLTGELIEAPTAAAAGESLAVTRILSNDGVEVAPHFEVAYYLSSNSAIGPDDIFLGRRSSSLVIGEDDFAIDVVSVPANVPPGDYVLGLILDPDGLVREVREDDNVVVGPTIPVFAPALTVVTETLPSVMLGVPYRASILTSGAPLGLSFRIERGALPPGLTLDETNGLISGVATEEGLFDFVIRALSGTAYAERALTLRVLTPTTDLAVATAALPTGLVGRPYRERLVAVGGIAPYRFSTPSALPAGLVLGEDGALSGTPAAPGQHLLIVQVEDAARNRAALELPLNLVNPGQSLLISQSPLPTAVVGREYCGEGERVRLQATGGLPPYTWRAASDLPPGLALTPESGELCGAPAREGQFPFTVRVEDATGAQDTSLFVFRAEGGTELAITTIALAPARVGQPYMAEIEAARGDTPYAFSIVESLGALPPGLLLSGDGILAGEPSASGVYAFQVRVVDALGRVDLEPLAIDVAPDPRSGQSDEGCGCSTTGASTGAPRLEGLLLGLTLLGLLLRVRARILPTPAAGAAVSGAPASMAPSSASRTRVARLALAILGAISATHVASALAPVPGTPYMQQTTAIRYAPLSGSTVLVDNGDDENVPVTLPFSFRYYDDTYDSIVVGANGAIIFGRAGTIGLGNASPGSAANPNAFLAPFWDDMHVLFGVGSIGTQVTGTAPNRTFTVEYSNVGRFGVSDSRWSAQVRLFEGQGGKMEIDYGPILGSGSFSATMAMEDKQGGRPIFFATSRCTTACTATDFGTLTNRRITLVQDPGLELVASAISGPTIGLVGGPLTVDVAVASLHGAAIGPFRVSVLLSRDDELGDPTVVGTSTLTVGPFERKRATVAGTVPATLAEGVYWLGLRVDTSDEIEEANEGNNLVASVAPIRILEPRPDLVVTRVSSTATAASASGTVRLAVHVENRGSLPAQPGEVAVMLSTNPVISPEDAELARYTVDLPPGAADTRELEVTIPAAASSGRFYLGALADPGANLGELSESNNGLAVQTPIDVTGAGIRILTTELPAALVGEAYVGALLAAGGGPTRTWRVSQGQLPEGLGLVAASGELYGRPRRVEVATFTVEATSEGATDQRVLSLSVIEPNTPLTVVTRDLPSATVGEEYSFRLIAVGGDDAKVWSASGLPEGMALSDQGVLAGVPLRISSATISVEVGSSGERARRELTLDIQAPTGLVLTPTLLPNARYGEAYRFTLSASGGTPPVTFRLDSGALPRGLQLAPDGTISGVPEEVRRTPFRFVVTAFDAEPEGLATRDSGTFELSVDDVDGFRIALESLPDAVKLEGYDVLVSTEGGEAPFEWSLEGSLPEGFATATTDTGVFRIAGLPSQAGLTPLLLRVVDARGRMAERALALRVLETPPTSAKGEGCGCASAREGDRSPLISLGLLIALWVLVSGRRRP